MAFELQLTSHSDALDELRRIAGSYAGYVSVTRQWHLEGYGPRMGVPMSVQEVAVHLQRMHNDYSVEIAIFVRQAQVHLESLLLTASVRDIIITMARLQVRHAIPNVLVTHICSFLDPGRFNHKQRPWNPPRGCQIHPLVAST